MAAPFLTATWSNLVLLTYAVDPAVLEPRLAPGLELDTRDGDAFVSFVAFDFLDTRVRGIAFPGLVNFPEINLRFYVRETGSARRGVMFVRELVPSRLIAWTALALYNEPYAATPMRSSVEETDDSITIRHDWTWKSRQHGLRVVSSRESSMPDPSSTAHFFKEHEWGFGKSRRGETLEYRVHHPAWEIHEVQSWELDADFAQIYGPEFALLSTAEPLSVIHAHGSPIEVYPPA